LGRQSIFDSYVKHELFTGYIIGRCERELQRNGYEWAWVEGSGKDTRQATRDKINACFFKEENVF
jgi:hypothetical protein